MDQTVVAYFDMLRMHVSGTSFVKAGVERRVATAIGRTTGAVGYKFSNISAILSEEGQIVLPGYGLSHNYQTLLRDRVLDWLTEEPDFHHQVSIAVTAPPAGGIGKLGPPKPAPTFRGWGREGARRTGRFPDYQAIEQRNRELGTADEKLVVQRELAALSASGRDDLAEKVRHVSAVEGDGIGYDVLSFYPDESPRYLEVKTTRNGALQPFFVSRNEVQFSEENAEGYTVVRIYQFGHRGMACYEIDGDLNHSAVLRSETYSARPAAQGS